MSKKKSLSASEMGKMGAQARMKKLTAERRKEIAKKAAKARWDKKKKKV